MKNTLWLIFFFSSAVISCENSDPGEEYPPHSTCTTSDPVEDLAWLREAIAAKEQQPENEFTQYGYIAQADYQGETVFIQGNCCPTCNSIISVVNCEDELIGFLGSGEGNIDFDILERAVIIWQPEDGVCSLNE